MALFLAKLIILFSSCVSVGGIVFPFCITIAAETGHAAVDLKLEVK